MQFAFLYIFLCHEVIFLDFEGVMDTFYYDFVLAREGKPNRDVYGPIFDPKCVDYLRHIIDQTGASIVVLSTWKWLMTCLAMS